MRRGLAALAAIALVAVVAAVAAASGAGAVAGGGAAEVRLSEFRVDAPRSLPAGPTELAIRNDGRLEHDLVVVRTRRAADDLPIGLSGVAPQVAGKVVFGEPHSAHDHGSAKAPRHHYARGGSERAEIRLTPGRYVLLCSLPGHYERGQRAALVVSAGG